MCVYIYIYILHIERDNDQSPTRMRPFGVSRTSPRAAPGASEESLKKKQQA